MIDASFYDYIIDIVGFQVQEGKIDYDRQAPWIWFRRASTIQERFLSGDTIDAFTTIIDVELVSADIDELQTQTDELKSQILIDYPSSGMMGDTWIMAAFILEHTDDYIPRSLINTDTGYHLASFSVKILHRA